VKKQPEGQDKKLVSKSGVRYSSPGPTNPLRERDHKKHMHMSTQCCRFYLLADLGEPLAHRYRMYVQATGD
jgi:hypothetical protein